MATNPTSYIKRGVIPLLALLIIATAITPLVAAAPTITPSKTKYNPGDTLSISGTATPNSAIAVRVYNPAGSIVGLGQGNTAAAGTYSVTVFTWPLTPTLTQPFGTYRVTATDAADGVTAETTVTYEQLLPPTPPPAKLAEALVAITISTGKTYQLDDTARIFILFTYNGSKVDPTATVLLIYPPGLTATPRTPAKISTGLYYLDYIPTATGVYAVHVEASAKGTTNAEVTSFTVTARLATAAGLTALSTDITARISTAQTAIVDRIATAQTALTSAIGGVSSAVAGVSSAVAGVSSKVDAVSASLSSAIAGVSSKVDGVSSKIDAVQSAVNAVKGVADSIVGEVRQVNTAVSDVKTAVGGIQSAVASQVGTIQTAVTNAIQQVRGDISGVKSDVDSLKTNIESVNTGVASSTTWIMIVGVLAAITLVLELAILVRKTAR